MVYRIAKMTSIQEKLQLKREPFDKWSLREQLCLASAVTRSGDQNWMSVSRSLKPFGESNRPLDWFHQKNCAAQYGVLLANVETPKRKKKAGVETIVETPAECILKLLMTDRLLELKNLLSEEKAEYRKLQDDMKILQSGRVSEEQLDKWCKEIDEEESEREQEALNHSKWLKQRDLRKQEIERAWMPLKASFPIVGQKRKLSDMADSPGENEQQPQLQQHESTSQYQHYLTTSQQCQQKAPPYSHQIISTPELHHFQPQESVKPALSPLLTSLLKSPSQVQNLSPLPSSILHTAITSQSNSKSVDSGDSSSTTIASLLNVTASTSVSSGMQHFSTCIINQEPTNIPNDDPSQPLDADILDDANFKIDDLAKSILVQDGPFPEIKKEEVDDIISEIIENAHDIVTDPEQHLQYDGNGDININIELDDFEQDPPINEENSKHEYITDTKAEAKSPLPTPVIDPFEFQEDPVLFSPVKPSSLKQDNTQYTPLYQHSPVKSDDVNKKYIEKNEANVLPSDTYDTSELIDNQLTKNVHGSVEIVEVGTEEHENEKELNKAQICDIVHSDKEKEVKEENMPQVLCETINETTKPEVQGIVHTVENEEEYCEQKISHVTSDIKFTPFTSQAEPVLDYADDLYDNLNMEVKIDKTGKTKRDYSRTKKREEKSFDMLLAIEKAQLDDMTMSDDIVEYKTENLKKEINMRIKQEIERSSSPWTEEEDGKSNKRRNSTPGTPVDSLPNSPASSIAFDDDKDYRNWKKSVMLVYNRLASNKYASLFLKPITDDQAPGYSTIVYRPMDLQTMKKNIDNGTIRTSLEFKRDVMLMFTNAIMYNKTNDTVFNMALQMQLESMNPIEILLQAEGQVDAPMRRETRTSESNCKRKRLSEDCVKNKKKKED